MVGTKDHKGHIPQAQSHRQATYIPKIQQKHSKNPSNPMTHNFPSSSLLNFCFYSISTIGMANKHNKCIDKASGIIYPDDIDKAVTDTP